jgi:hypothetical protein
MLFANTKAFWLSMFDAFFHSAVELIESASVRISFIFKYRTDL